MRDDSPTPDRDPAAEAAVLGAMMMAPDCINDVAALLTGPDFAEYRHEVIFDAITKLHADAAPTDPVAVAGHLMRSGDINRIGGAPYLHTLFAHAPVAAQAPYYAEQVRLRAHLRYLGSLGIRFQQMRNNPETDPDDIPELLLTAIRDLEGMLEQTEGAVDNAPTASAMLEDTIRSIEKPDVDSHIVTGLPDLDDFYPGHSAGHLVVVGARPAVGKTIVGLTFARHAVNAGVPTLFVSLEMSRAEMMRRLVAAESGVALDSLTKGVCTDYDWDRIAAASSRILDGKLYIDDTPGQGLPQIRSTLSKLKRTTGVGMLVLDYIQLMDTPKAENRQQGVSAVSRGLKLIAKEFGIPVIALSQLNRDSEKRQDKVPVPADLRESGSLEQDADSIFLLHREDRLNPEFRPNELDVYVPKSRHGRPGMVTVTVQGHYSRVVPFFKAWTPHNTMRGAA